MRRATRRLSEAKLRPAFSGAASADASFVRSASALDIFGAGAVTSIGQYVLGIPSEQAALAESCHARLRPGTRGHRDWATEDPSR